MKIALFLTLTLYLANAQATAAEYESASRVRQAVTEALGPMLPPGTTVEMRPLDKRLRLARCATPPRASTPHRIGGTRATVRVRCSDSWTIHVPVVLSREVAMLVLKRPLAAGQSIEASDLEVQPRQLASAPLGYLDSPEAALNRVARQTLPAGTVLRATHLRDGRAVSRGEQVRLVAGQAGFEITSAGEALGNAPIGGRVRVRNLSSKRIVEGRVRAAGIVEVR